MLTYLTVNIHSQILSAWQKHWLNVWQSFELIMKAIVVTKSHSHTQQRHDLMMSKLHDASLCWVDVGWEKILSRVDRRSTFATNGQHFLWLKVLTQIILVRFGECHHRWRSFKNCIPRRWRHWWIRGGAILHNLSSEIKNILVFQVWVEVWVEYDLLLGLEIAVLFHRNKCLFALRIPMSAYFSQMLVLLTGDPHLGNWHLCRDHLPQSNSIRPIFLRNLSDRLCRQSGPHPT